MRYYQSNIDTSHDLFIKLDDSLDGRMWIKMYYMDRYIRIRLYEDIYKYMQRQFTKKLSHHFYMYI